MSGRVARRARREPRAARRRLLPTRRTVVPVEEEPEHANEARRAPRGDLSDGAAEVLGGKAILEALEREESDELRLQCHDLLRVQLKLLLQLRLDVLLGVWLVHQRVTADVLAHRRGLVVVVVVVNFPTRPLPLTRVCRR